MDSTCSHVENPVDVESDPIDGEEEVSSGIIRARMMSRILDYPDREVGRAGPSRSNRRSGAPRSKSTRTTRLRRDRPERTHGLHETSKEARKSHESVKELIRMLTHHYDALEEAIADLSEALE